MRTLRWIFRFFLCVAVASAAQPKHKTDAQNDGFEGSIRTVTTHVERARVNWSQPSGPTVALPIFCHDCNYDPDGSRTRSGEVSDDGRFLGEDIAIVRDGQGHVVERTRISTIDGKVFEREKNGPFGPVEETYPDGPVARSTKTYDRLGYLSEWLSFDANGQQVSRQTIRTNPDGQWTDRAVWDKDGRLTYRETYDPETDLQRFESFDSSGAAKVTFTFAHGHVLTFWSATDEPNQFGSSFSDDRGNGNFSRFNCHKGGDCEINPIHYTYADSSKRNPTSVEWHNAEGAIVNAAYYEYEFDDQHNWTKRTVWVRSPEIPERTLYETDTRVISYWDR